MSTRIRSIMDLAAADVAVMLDVVTPAGASGIIESVTIDSRQVRPGALFVALPGPRYDGHDFVAAAAERGAVAAVVSRRVDCPLPQFIVENSHAALSRLAAAWRRHCATPLVAVTGSNGKTTVKEMLVSILGRLGPVAATEGNLNNEIGVPLSLLSLRPSDRHAVIEIGANHPGEIDRLSRLARPDVSVINNAASAHLAGFGNLKAVARAKGEIIAGLPSDGRVVINHDDPCVGVWWQLAANHQQIGYAIDNDADVMAEEVQSLGLEGSRFILTTSTGSRRIDLALPGEHNVANALAAAAAALAMGVSLDDIAAGLAAVHGVSGRLEPVTLANGALAIDDTYNANPRSLTAALRVLTSSGRRHQWLVLGDMAELGVCSESFHVKAGHEARARMIERLYAHGELSRLSVDAFGEGGSSFASREAIVDALSTDMEGVAPEQLAILFKGSRSAGMERVLHALQSALLERGKVGSGSGQRHRGGDA